MLTGPALVQFEHLTPAGARQLATDAISAIGHADTAAVVSGLLGREIEPDRIDIKLAPGDQMMVAQYTGPRLPEGATMLPKGARVTFWLVTVS